MYQSEILSSINGFPPLLVNWNKDIIPVKYPHGATTVAWVKCECKCTERQKQHALIMHVSPEDSFVDINAYVAAG